MTRSEVRTGEAWRAYDGAVLVVALLGLLALLLLWWMGSGPTQAGCCAGPTAATSTAVQPTVPAPVTMPVPEPAKAEPTVAAGTQLPEPAKTELPKTGVVPTPVPAVACSQLVDSVSVHFAFDSAVLTGEARATLDKALDCLKHGRYQVAGHADNVGNSAVNQRLSEARANAVVAYLRRMGIEANRLSAVGFGDTRPVADNATAEGRAQNRRVVFTRLP